MIVQVAMGSTSHIDLSPETVLQLAPGIRTRFDASGHVLLDAPNGTVVDTTPIEPNRTICSPNRAPSAAW